MGVIVLCRLYIKILSKFRKLLHFYRDESFVRVIVVFPLASKVGRIELHNCIYSFGGSGPTRVDMLCP